MSKTAIKSVEVVPEGMTISNETDMVNLIDQPTWKTILISLVESERMDVWNIDIKILAEKYLEKIKSLQTMDLRLPANAILASAILLRLKARTLEFSSLEEDEPVYVSEEDFLGGILPELKNPRMLREGKISLDELVESIQGILEKTKTGAFNLKNREMPVFQIPIPTFNIEEKMEQILEKISQSLDETGLTTFAKLTVGGNALDIVESFIAVLFLGNQKKINVWQDEFFGEIFITVRKELPASE